MGKFKFTVPENRRIRMILDTDAGCECDDSFAIAYALLSQKIEMKAIIAAHFGDLRGPNTMEESYAECRKIVDLMGLTDKFPILKGAKKCIKNAPDQESAGADFIIEEALRDDPKPLYAVFIGPLTDLAIAIEKEPRICGRLNVIWIGGPDYPAGGYEYNLSNDIAAANMIMKSNVPLSVINMDCYVQMKIGLAELQDRLTNCGKIGRYLFEQLIEGNVRNCADSSWLPGMGGMTWPLGESWWIVDILAIAIALEPHDYFYEWKMAPYYTDDMHIFIERLARPIKVYSNINYRYAFEDLFAKLKIIYGDE